MARLIKINSSSRGPVENTRYLNRNSTPFTPRSITLLNPPVFRVMWYCIDIVWICSKVSSANRRRARCATFAKSESRICWKPFVAIRAKAYATVNPTAPSAKFGTFSPARSSTAYACNMGPRIEIAFAATNAKRASATRARKFKLFDGHMNGATRFITRHAASPSLCSDAGLEFDGLFMFLLLI